VNIETLIRRPPKIVAVADPAADAEFSHTVPADVKWLLLVATVSLVQGATQTPWPSLVIDDGTTVIGRSMSGTAAQSANITTQHTWSHDGELAGGAGGAASTGSLPGPVLLLPGYRIRSITAGKGANSDYGAPSLYVVEI